MCSDKAATGVVDASQPSIRTFPVKRPLRICGARPFTRRISVVFPQPDAPVTSFSSPGSTVSERFVTASRSLWG